MIRPEQKLILNLFDAWSEFQGEINNIYLQLLKNINHEFQIEQAYFHILCSSNL